jgi:hypothetical protein
MKVDEGLGEECAGGVSPDEGAVTFVQPVHVEGRWCLVRESPKLVNVGRKRGGGHNSGVRLGDAN